VSYHVELRRAAQKQLDALHGRAYVAVAKGISALGQSPRPPRVKKLAESGLWRIRVRECRIVYTIDDKVELVTVCQGRELAR